MKKIIILIVFCILLASFVSANTKNSGPSLQITLKVIQNALLDKDMVTLNRHIAFQSIVESKLKKYSKVAKKNKSFGNKVLGNAMSLGQPMFGGIATNFILKEYAKSPRSLRQYYYNSLKINSIKEKGNNAVARVSFMGSPGLIYCTNTNNTWMITNVESPVIDQEFQNLMKIISRKK